MRWPTITWLAGELRLWNENTEFASTVYLNVWLSSDEYVIDSVLRRDAECVSQGHIPGYKHRFNARALARQLIDDAKASCGQYTRGKFVPASASYWTGGPSGRAITTRPAQYALPGTDDYGPSDPFYPQFYTSDRLNGLGGEDGGLYDGAGFDADFEYYEFLARPVRNIQVSYNRFNEPAYSFELWVREKKKWVRLEGPDEPTLVEPETFSQPAATDRAPMTQMDVYNAPPRQRMSREEASRKAGELLEQLDRITGKTKLNGLGAPPRSYGIYPNITYGRETPANPLACPQCGADMLFADYPCPHCSRDGALVYPVERTWADDQLPPKHALRLAARRERSKGEMEEPGYAARILGPEWQRTDPVPPAPAPRTRTPRRRRRR